MVPTRDDPMNYEVDLPWTSAMLFCSENLMLMFALEAEMSRKQTLFSMLDTDPINKKSFGKARAEISSHIDMLRRNSPKNRNFLTSESKF